MKMVYLLNGFIRRIESFEVSDDNDERNLSKQQLLFILMIGYSISILTFTVEYFMSNLKKSKKYISIVYDKLIIRSRYCYGWIRNRANYGNVLKIFRK